MLWKLNEASNLSNIFSDYPGIQGGRGVLKICTGMLKVDVRISTIPSYTLESVILWPKLQIWNKLGAFLAKFSNMHPIDLAQKHTHRYTKNDEKTPWNLWASRIPSTSEYPYSLTYLLLLVGSVSAAVSDTLWIPCWQANTVTFPIGVFSTAVHSLQILDEGMTLLLNLVWKID